MWVWGGSRPFNCMMAWVWDGGEHGVHLCLWLRLMEGLRWSHGRHGGTDAWCVQVFGLCRLFLHCIWLGPGLCGGSDRVAKVGAEVDLMGLLRWALAPSHTGTKAAARRTDFKHPSFLSAC
jgi:hypothetical protein